ncbi:COG4223 family protein [Phaeovulum sp.]|uniref:COG4223 family protein n=1 Tax=Phaeovulum sp. TaxID=2934796 RepID=UPI0039E67685
MAKPKTPKAELAEQPDIIVTPETKAPDETITADDVNTSDKADIPDDTIGTDEANTPADPPVTSEPDQPVQKAAPPSPAPEPATPPKITAPAAPPRRSGFFSMLLGGIAAAAIGAGGVIYVLPKLPQGWVPLPKAAQVDEAALRAAISENTAQATALAKDVSALKAAPAPQQPDLSAIEAALADAAQRADTLAQSVAALDERVSVLEKRPVAGGAASDSALEAFGREMDDMRALIAQSQDSSAAAQAQIAAAAKEAAARITAAESEAAAMRAEAEASASRTMAQAALARLAAALDSGGSAESALTDLRAANVTIPDVLTGDVPSLPALRIAFPEAARTALIVSRKVTAGDGTMDKLGAFLMAQTGARSLEPQVGDSPDAVLSRAEAALASGDVAQAVAEISALPPEGGAAMADWRAMAEKRLSATTALADLAKSLN